MSWKRVDSGLEAGGCSGDVTNGLFEDLSYGETVKVAVPAVMSRKRFGSLRFILRGRLSATGLDRSSSTAIRGLLNGWISLVRTTWYKQWFAYLRRIRTRRGHSLLNSILRAHTESELDRATVASSIVLWPICWSTCNNCRPHGPNPEGVVSF